MNCSDVSCESGSYLFVSPLQPTSTCKPCENGTFSLGGGKLITRFTDPLPFEFRNECYGYRGGAYLAGNSCNKWKVSADGSFIHSGNNTEYHRLFSVLQMAVVLVRPGYIMFKFKVDSEERFDGLTFLVNGEVSALGFKSTVLDWTEIKIPLPPGAHDLKWEYYKDASESRGLDYAAIQVIRVDGVDYADVDCMACNSVFAPGCKLCAADMYQVSLLDPTCVPCPPNTYAFEGSVGAVSCHTRPKCTSDDFFLQSGPCTRGANNKLSREVWYEWTSPKVCNESLPGSVDLPQPSNVKTTQDCPPCQPGSVRNPDATCVSCELGKYSSDGVSQCKSCPSGSYAPNSLSFNRFRTLPEGFSADCSAATFSGECPEGMGWQPQDSYLSSGLNVLPNSDLYLQTTVNITNAHATVSFVYSLVNPEEGTQLLFYINNVTVFATPTTGVQEVHNATFTTSVKTGLAMLQWIYRRHDSDSSDSDDRAYIHSIKITGTSTGGASECLPCPPGSFTTDANSHTCTLCPAGQFASSPGSKTCEQCGINQFSSLPGSTGCTGCAANTRSDRGSPTCNIKDGLDFTVERSHGVKVDPPVKRHFNLASYTIPGKVVGPIFTEVGESFFYFTVFDKLEPGQLNYAYFPSGGYAYRVRESYVERQSSTGIAFCDNEVQQTVLNAGRDIGSLEYTGDSFIVKYVNGDQCAEEGPDAARNLTTTIEFVCGEEPSLIDIGPWAAASKRSRVALGASASSSVGAGAPRYSEVISMSSSSAKKVPDVRMTSRQALEGTHPRTVFGAETRAARGAPRFSAMQAMPPDMPMPEPYIPYVGPDDFSYFSLYSGRVNQSLTDNCTVHYVVFSMHACPLCEKEDFDYLLTCDNDQKKTTAEFKKKLFCWDPDNKVENKFKSDNANVASKNSSNDGCLELNDYLNSKMSSRRKIVLLAVLVVGLIGFAGVIGFLYVRLRGSKAKVDRELNRLRNQYGEKLMTEEPLDGEDMGGSRPSHSLAMEMSDSDQEQQNLRP